MILGSFLHCPIGKALSCLRTRQQGSDTVKLRLHDQVSLRGQGIAAFFGPTGDNPRRMTGVFLYPNLSSIKYPFSKPGRKYGKSGDCAVYRSAPVDIKVVFVDKFSRGVFALGMV